MSVVHAIPGMRYVCEWPFGDKLGLMSYDRIIADPPWIYENWSEKGEGKNAAQHYRCMPDAEILALPVGHLASRDCILFLWATWPRLDFAFQCVKAWGFQYKTGGAWRKLTSGGKTAFNTGYILRNACDPFLIATVGKPALDKSQCSRIRNLIEAKHPGSHSRKPKDAHDLMDRIAPRGRGAELFSREDRPGWECWGDETGKFNDQPTKENTK